MTIGLLFSAICSGLIAAATAVAMDAGFALAGLAYMLGGSLGVSAFVSLVEIRRVARHRV